MIKPDTSKNSVNNDLEFHSAILYIISDIALILVLITGAVFFYTKDNLVGTIFFGIFGVILLYHFKYKMSLKEIELFFVYTRQKTKA